MIRNKVYSIVVEKSDAGNEKQSGQNMKRGNFKNDY